MDKEISERIWITRYFMVIGIIILHLPPSQPLNEVISVFDHIKAFFTHGVFRATVPVLTVLSGYLVFQSGLYLEPVKLVSKKVKTVLFPLIIWNIPFVVAIYLSQRYGLLSHNFSDTLYPFDALSWINALVGLFESPANYPLNFLRDLFAVSLLSPLFGFLLKRIPYLGLCLVLIVYYFNLEGPFVLRNGMLVSFYLGGLAAKQSWSLTSLDKYAKHLLFIFLAFCIGIVTFKITNLELFRLLSPFLIWPAMSLVKQTKAHGFLKSNCRFSFVTFLAHGPIILILWIVFQKLPIELPYYIYWVFAPIITVLLCISLVKPFKKLLPNFSSVILGGR
ncbi:acyltransferase family protein [Vibrio sp. 10N.261.55.A7]|uniref:acyltransferase family protein n=1 Tax=Vibrio sp. 10N.261.55.A7 TaxID=1880851 RepID=UPI001055C99B|nr:acyltransferase family protein [Vibrio sp. 10N.261.55.A7]